MLTEINAAQASVDAELGTWAASRFETVPPQHLALNERVKVAFEYAECCAGEFRRQKGEVATIAWCWGVDAKTVVRCYTAARYTNELQKAPRLQSEETAAARDAVLVGVMNTIMAAKVTALRVAQHPAAALAQPPKPTLNTPHTHPTGPAQQEEAAAAV